MTSKFYTFELLSKYLLNYLFVADFTHEVHSARGTTDTTGSVWNILWYLKSELSEIVYSTQ